MLMTSRPRASPTWPRDLNTEHNPPPMLLAVGVSTGAALPAQPVQAHRGRDDQEARVLQVMNSHHTRALHRQRQRMHVLPVSPSRDVLGVSHTCEPGAAVALFPLSICPDWPNHAYSTGRRTAACSSSSTSSSCSRWTAAASPRARRSAWARRTRAWRRRSRLGHRRPRSPARRAPRHCPSSALQVRAHAEASSRLSEAAVSVLKLGVVRVCALAPPCLSCEVPSRYTMPAVRLPVSCASA